MSVSSGCFLAHSAHHRFLRSAASPWLNKTRTGLAQIVGQVQASDRLIGILSRNAGPNRSIRANAVEITLLAPDNLQSSHFRFTFRFTAPACARPQIIHLTWCVALPISRLERWSLHPCTEAGIDTPHRGTYGHGCLTAVLRRTIFSSFPSEASKWVARFLFLGSQSSHFRLLMSKAPVTWASEHGRH
jgi:hypothetical protein